jgi:hypothetical protein
VRNGSMMVVHTTIGRRLGMHEKIAQNNFDMPARDDYAPMDCDGMFLHQLVSLRVSPNPYCQSLTNDEIARKQRQFTFSVSPRSLSPKCLDSRPALAPKLDLVLPRSKGFYFGKDKVGYRTKPTRGSRVGPGSYTSPDLNPPVDRKFGRADRLRSHLPAYAACVGLYEPPPMITRSSVGGVWDRQGRYSNGVAGNCCSWRSKLVLSPERRRELFDIARDRFWKHNGP